MLPNFMKAGIAAGAAFTLPACVPALDVTSPVVQAGYLASFDQDRVARSRVVTIRSYSGSDSDRVEFAGAQCEMLSDEITARFVTPAKIMVPAFVQNKNLEQRGRPSNLRIVCTANGNTGVETFAAEDKRVSGAVNAGIAGAIITTLVSGAIASSTPWSYPTDMVVQVNGVSP
ncbi:MAG: hypothetical protein L3J37_05340 [Rhodobacteraceae bacterium]|nr:hypothetical protein [Paracoccaceae bacterium]